MARLHELARDYPCIGEVRGKGLMIGMELIETDAARTPARALCDASITRAFHNGLLLLSCGASTVRFMPPLNVTRDEIDEGDGAAAQQPRRSARRGLTGMRDRRCGRVAVVAASAGCSRAAVAAAAGREPVLKQVDLPHSYYWRELYLPQLTTGPSSRSFLPDGEALVYSMAGSLWRQRIGGDEAVELTHAAGAYDYQPDVARDGRSVVFTRYDGNAHGVVAARSRPAAARRR